VSNLVVDVVDHVGEPLVTVEGGSRSAEHSPMSSYDVSFKPLLGERRIMGKGGPSLVFGARLSRFAENLGLTDVWVKTDGLEVCESMLGSMLAQYRFTKYMSNTNGGEPRIHYVGCSDADFEDAASQAEAVRLARDLGNEPAGSLSPAKFVDAVKHRFSALPVEIEVLGESELESKGFGGIVGVGKGSVNPPRLLVVKYSGGGGRENVAIVGKGVVFDSGGINLKPSDGGIERMYSDKCGAADTVATVLGAALLDLKIDVVGVAPLVENMPSGSALKPGDIILTYSGRSVEVLSTDAEGRLILADALSYTIEKYSPNLIVDIATLTGSKNVALGSKIGAIMGNNQPLIDELTDAGNTSLEAFWQLPLPPVYREMLRSERADIKNIVGGGSREAGTIIGGLFLKEFVPDNTPWVHLDIAGSAFSNTEYDWVPKGATGFSVRTLLEFLRRKSDVSPDGV